MEGDLWRQRDDMQRDFREIEKERDKFIYLYVYIYYVEREFMKRERLCEDMFVRGINFQLTSRLNVVM